ncbi:glycosyl hydrolase [Paenibacillus sp. NPDC056579]|uniref:glycosyl hydrolase n=2 Tax=Bacillales TaxID=1385 RepID=UPI0036A66AAD
MISNDRFQFPPVEFRVHPFWFWNGEMEEEEIARQIGEMKDKGVGGIFICARQGMDLPYLSRLWFDRVKFAVKTAQQAGLNVWLYDEYPYPSGMAGGEVTLEHPEAKQRMLSRTVQAFQGGEDADMDLPWGRVLWAKAVPYTSDGVKDWEQAVDVTPWIGSFQDETVFQQTGSTNYSRKRYFTYHTVKRLRYELPASAVQWEVIVITEQEVDDFKYFGTFVDPLHPEAVDTFMQMTHERYAEEMGEYFGGTIKGMFTDEVGLRAGKLPWSPQIVPFFQERCGYNLLDKLHMLYENAGEETARVRYDLFQCIHLMLRERFHKKVADWCDKYCMEYVAEVPSVRMTTQLHSHIPGGDSAHEKLGRTLPEIMKRYAHSLRHNPKMGSSLSRQLGKQRALIECFHSIGWSMTLQDARWMIDWMAVLGTNMFNFHAFFYSIDGLRKHDAAPSQFEQNPYWEHFALLGDYIGRLSWLMSEGAAKIDIAVLDPTTSLWTHMGNPFHQFGFAGVGEREKKTLEQLKSSWIEIQTALLTNQRDYDTLDPEMLMEASVEEGMLKLGAAQYRVLIIPPVSNLEAAAWAKLRSFLQAGGTVISVGSLPYETIEQEADTVTDMADWFLGGSGNGASDGAGVHQAGETSAWRQGKHGAYFVPYADGAEGAPAIGTLLKLLDRTLARTVELHSEDGLTDTLLMQHRRIDDQSDVVFIANHGRAEKQVQVYLDAAYFGSDIQLVYRDLETGGQAPILPERVEEGKAVFKLTFAPYQSHLVEIASKDALPEVLPVSSIAAEQTEPLTIEVHTDTAWDLELTEPNLLRIGRFQLTVDEQDVGLEQGWPQNQVVTTDQKWYEVDAKTWISQTADHAREWKHPLTYRTHWFGTPFKLNIEYPVVCWYKAVFEVEQLPEAAELTMDREAILGEHSLFVNGTLWDGGFVPLVQGLNTLMVRVVIRHAYEGVVDPIYLRGTFGVRFKAGGLPVITDAPVQGNPNHAVIEGCPFYSGTALFRQQSVALTADPAAAEAFELTLSGLSPHFHDCAEVRVNGHSLGVRAWTPYRWSGRTEWLRPDGNTIELRVNNTLSLRLDGTYFDYEAHQIKETSSYVYDLNSQGELK